MKDESIDRKKILVDWNDTKAPYPKNKTIYQLFEEQVKKNPDNIAVIFEEEKLSYKDLNKKANQLAHLIRAKYKKQQKKYLTPDSLIGLCMERSLDMIIGILGILKAGGAYVPLDPDYPQDRLEYMIEDSHEGLIITQKYVVSKDGFLDKLHHDELLIIDSDEVKAELSKQSADNLEKVSGPDDLAYVIYTSGSTGRPKGVQQEQGACVNRIFWMQQEYKLQVGETYLHKTPIGFDVSFGEILWPLSVGGKLIIAKPSAQGDLPYLSDLIFKYKIKNIHFVPALLSVFCDYIRENELQDTLKSLKRVFCSGDALTIDHRSQLLDVLSVQLHNLYGPTESGEISYYDCSQDESYSRAILSIGKPINNSQFYILNNNLTLCPIGAPGELYIGGVGLARGYLNQEKLTNERFIPNPFSKELSLSKSDRIYKTGDLVMWLPDGNIEYLGRTDFQVKFNGFRIELGEIESVLAKHKAISQVTVIDKEKKGQKYLAAYYVIAKDTKEPEIDVLIDHLSEALPDYMVPAAFVKLDEMPLTPNGKIDRRALPDPDMSLMGEAYVAPRNETESILCGLFQDILGLDEVGIKDNFFKLGGNSILAAHLIIKMKKKLGVNYSIADFLESKNICNLVLSDSVQHEEIDDSKSYNINELHYFENLILLHQLQTDNTCIYNENSLISIDENISIEQVSSAAQYLVDKYEVLNSNYKLEGDNFVRIINHDGELICENIILDSERNLKSTLAKMAQKPFDLTGDKLLRFYLINLPNKQYVNVVFYHAIFDATSLINIMLPSFCKKIQDSKYDYDYSKQEISDFLNFSKAISRNYENDKKKKINFWKKNILDCELISLGNKPTSSIDHVGSQLSFVFDKEVTKSLKEVSSKLGVSLFSILYSLFSLLIIRVSGNDKSRVDQGNLTLSLSQNRT